MIHQEEGWKAAPYIWNEEQTEATFDIIGSIQDISWINTEGEEVNINYIIPNKNQCKSCHVHDGEVMPIGPKVRNLNKDFVYADGTKNQLEKWERGGTP